MNDIPTQQPTVGADLRGRVALITGAGRARGMGRATALALAAAGADVVVTDLGQTRTDLQARGIGLGDNLEELEETADLARALGRRALALSLDVTDSERARAVVNDASAALGTIDILVNNAGTAVGTEPFFDIQPHHWQLSWSVNVLGAVNLVQAVAPGMVKARRGAIINIASTLGIAALAEYGAYVVTKHAVVGLTRLLARELGPSGIRTNAVAPGYIVTDMGHAELSMVAAQLGVDEDTASTAIVEEIPLGRIGVPDDVAGVTAWLATSAASFINGAVIPVSGGQIAGFA
ncbi:SDR family NAD(P)-dependent oxidoreductase [Nocardia tengchongensis]|uniref:SDR family NAD(P)-dependent oxidoreductase n=1 Tax=Nocardia tengchongensis TaxID=2055889 RepID=UPI0036B1C5DD